MLTTKLNFVDVNGLFVVLSGEGASFLLKMWSMLTVSAFLCSLLEVMPGAMQFAVINPIINKLGGT